MSIIESIDMAKPILSVEIEHIFNRGLFNDPLVKAALALANIYEDMRANKRLLLTDQQTINRIQDGPQNLKDGLIEGRGSIVRHEGAAPTGNQLGKLIFLRTEVREIMQSGAPQDAKNAAYLNLLKWTDALAAGKIVGADGRPLPVMGNTDYAALLTQAYDSTRINAAAFDDPANTRAQTIKAELASFVTPDGKQTISDQKAKVEIIDKMSVSLGDKALLLEHQKQAIAQANGDTSAQKATNAAVMMLHDAMANAGIAETRERAIIERLAAGLSGRVDAVPNETTFDALVKQLTTVFSTLKKYSDAFVSEVRLFGDTIVSEATRSAKALMVGLGGGIALDVLEYINLAYVPFKKGIQTGDWTDFGNVTAQYGAAIIVSAILVTGSIIAASAVVGGAAVALGASAGAAAAAAKIAASFVAAGWLALGYQDAIKNAGELYQKITADLADVIPKIGKAIEEAGEGIKRLSYVITTIFEAVKNDYQPPKFAQADGLAKIYVADPLNPAQPDKLYGSDVAERFYGRNNAFIDAGGGNDVITFKNGFGEGRGGEGKDILIAGQSRYD